MAGADLVAMPFNYRRLPDGQFLVVNPAGEFVRLSPEQFGNLYDGFYDSLGDAFGRLRGMQLIASGDASLETEMLAVKLRTRKDYLSNFTSLHMVVVTQRCNFRCDYCHASSADPGQSGWDMDPRTARAVVDTIFRSPSPAIKIEFQGGEPLLNFGIIKEIVKYAKEVNRKKRRHLSFVICTNLTLVDEEVVAFCKENGVDFSSSLDGPKDLHDLHRVSRDGTSGYDGFIRSLALIRREMGNGACAPLLTVTRDHLGRISEVIDEYVALGFDGLFLRALNPYGNAVVNRSRLGYSVEEFVETYKDALDYIIRLNLEKKVPFTEFYSSLLLQRILTPFPTGFVDLQSPAGAGLSGAIYDHNGDVYPADEGRMLARMGDTSFRMGNVHEDSYEGMFRGPVMRDIVDKSCVETMPMCAGCAYCQYCGADPVRYHVECGDIMGSRPESAFCRKNMAVIDHLFNLMDAGGAPVQDLFWAWANRRRFTEVAP